MDGFSKRGIIRRAKLCEFEDLSRNGTPYLRVTVREDQLVIDCDRFPLCQRFNQQLLFDLGNRPQDLKMMTNMQTNMESHGSESRCYLQQF